MSVAFRLRQAGVSVTVLERGVCGRESSWSGAGIVSLPNPHRSDPLATIHRASVDRYAAYCAELADLSGVDPEYEVCGELKFLTTDQSVQMAKSDIRVAGDSRTAAGEPVLELLTTGECAEIEPNVTGDALAVLRCRRTAQARNPRLMRALLESCRRLGVTVREHTGVTSLELDGDRVIGVRGEDETFHAKHVVLCAGAWSARVGPARLADLLPVFPVRGQIILLRLDSRPFKHIVDKRRSYLVPRRDGHVLIGVTDEPEAGFDKRNTAKGINHIISEAVSMAPCLADAAVVGMWSGLRPGTPDKRPYIGPVPGFEGLIAATGHYRSGLTLAPVTADIVKELITDGQCTFDLSYCAPGRRLVRA